MRELVELRCETFTPLASDEEGRMLDAAFGMVCEPLRSSGRKVRAIRDHADQLVRAKVIPRNTMSFKNVVLEQQADTMALELALVCSQALDLCDGLNGMPYIGAVSEVVSGKVRGDALRYLTEIGHQLPRGQNIHKRALESYRNANKVAMAQLSPLHPVLLSNVLNLSVQWADAIGRKDKAVQVAKAAFDRAIGISGQVQGMDEYCDSFSVLRRLKANATKWADENRRQFEGHAAAAEAARARHAGRRATNDDGYGATGAHVRRVTRTEQVPIDMQGHFVLIDVPESAQELTTNNTKTTTTTTTTSSSSSSSEGKKPRRRSRGRE